MKYTSYLYDIKIEAMKLYTEEQVKESFKSGFRLAMETDGGLKEGQEEIFNLLTPVELPSDDEIKSYSDRYSTMHEDVSDKLGKYIVSAIHIDGANWMKEQLYDGVRLKRFIKDEGEQINGAKWMKEQILGKEDKTFKQKSKWTEVDNMTRRLK